MVHVMKKIKAKERNCHNFSTMVVGADWVGEDPRLRLTNNYLRIIRGQPN